ncbi:MAG TPA: molybdopterin molybdotransferase MoeA, partial [Prolixibacteraceae bacterium]|nr:molybdopterin molybdotransferase MoeA [Prolixibacteraceae bacterium]
YDMDMPPFNKSAMDGFACRKGDLKNKLEIIETIFAGKQPEKTIQKNHCYKIMTGAVVPAEADVVFKIEDAEITTDGRVLCTKPSTGSNICYRGEDVQNGQVVLGGSTLLTSRHLPVLAGAGVSAPSVYRQPNVTVFASGTELVEPNEKPLWYQIRNSNSSQLLAQLAEIGINAKYGGVVKDNKSQLFDEIEAAFLSNEIIILTGGVSVGEYDFIPGMLDELGFEILVRSTAIKPGKPMSFARKGAKYCFGLSGNPVSSFVQFELYVKPFVYKMMGYKYKPEQFRLPLATGFKRKNAGRINFVPANINKNMQVEPVEFHGSAHINALSGASYLLEVPLNSTMLKKGEIVNVRSIQ